MRLQPIYSPDMLLTPTPSQLFFTKNDPQDPRMGEWAALSQNEDLHFQILGFPDDEGIQINGGRKGASLAPDLIRKYFYKMTPDASVLQKFSIEDIGNMSLKGTLEERHERGRNIIFEIAQKKQRWISLGGGHDYGYCDTAGFLQAEKAVKPLIVNFDAHLDVRPTDKGLSSGTPFFRLMSEFGSACSLVEIGLQPQCNSPYHARWLTERGGQILWRDQISENNIVQKLQEIIPLTIHPTFISVDIDALSSAIAPGCSQSWASGLEWKEFARAFDFLIELFDVRGLGIYEVSPPLDQDDKTSKLAATIMHRFIFQNLKKSR